MHRRFISLSRLDASHISYIVLNYSCQLRDVFYYFFIVDPCHFTNYEVIKDQVKRSSNYTLMPDGEMPIDDSNLIETFYRFDSLSGNDIVNSQQNMNQCGTKFTMYMIGK